MSEIRSPIVRDLMSEIGRQASVIRDPESDHLNSAARLPENLQNKQINE